MFDLSQFYNYCQKNAVDVIPYMDMPSAGATIRDGEDLAIFLDIRAITTLRQLKGICLHEMGQAGRRAKFSSASTRTSSPSAARAWKPPRWS